MEDSAESEAKWQKHVVVLIWVALVGMLILACVLFYAKGHGLIGPTPGHGAPLPAIWPEGA